MKHTLLYLLLFCPVAVYAAPATNVKQVRKQQKEEQIYEVTANNKWKFAGIVSFENDNIILNTQYFPPNLLQSLNPSMIKVESKGSLLIINKSALLERNDDTYLLKIDIPVDMFTDQNVLLKNSQVYPSVPIDALYGNYDINYADKVQGSFSMTYASKDNWLVRNNVLWNGEKLVRLNSVWQKQNKDNSAWFAGDVASTSLTGFNSPNVLGLRFATPYFNSARYMQDALPLLPISGYALNPSKLDLYINNQLIQQSEVSTGRYNLQVPFQTNGLGVAQAYVYDIVGKPVIVSVPFYNNNEVIQQGRTEYDVSAGFIRKNLGTDSFNYSVPAVQGLVKYGVASNYTQDAFIQSSPLYSAASLLSHYIPNPTFGIISAGVSINSEKQHLLRLGYDRLSSDFSFGANIQKSREFCMGYDQSCIKQEVQAYGSFNLPQNYGSISANYVRRDTNKIQQDVTKVQYNMRLTRDVNLYTNVSHNKYSNGTISNNFYVGLTWNLDHGINTYTSVNRENNTLSYQQSMSFSENLENQRGYGSVTVNRNGANNSTNIYYGNHLSAVDYTINYLRDQTSSHTNINVRGGAAYIPKDNYFTLTRPSISGLAYVNVENATQPVEILHQNKVYGSTNNKGQLVVSDVIALNNEHLEVNMATLPPDLTLEESVQTTAIPFSGAVEVKFKGKALPYVIILHGAKLGTVFNMGNTEFVVGKNSQASVDGSGSTTIIINGKSCNLDITPAVTEYFCESPTPKIN